MTRMMSLSNLLPTGRQAMDASFGSEWPRKHDYGYRGCAMAPVVHDVHGFVETVQTTLFMRCGCCRVASTKVLHPRKFLDANYPSLQETLAQRAPEPVSTLVTGLASVPAGPRGRGGSLAR